MGRFLIAVAVVTFLFAAWWAWGDFYYVQQAPNGPPGCTRADMADPEAVACEGVQ